LISFAEIQDWGAVSELHRKEREALLKVLPKYDLYFKEYNQPGVTAQSTQKRPKYARKPPEVPVTPPPSPVTDKTSGKRRGSTREAFCAWKKVEMGKKGKIYDQAKVEQIFDRMDDNGDGLVTREEQRAYYDRTK